MASVSIREVWKIYGKTAAVKDLNIECPGRRVPLRSSGRPGCGKSSTMRMIAGLEHISAGDICFGERRINDLPPKDRDIAMVFENYALYPHKTVYENMANPLRLRGTDRATIERKVAKAAELLEIGAAAAAPSGGALRRPEAAHRDRPGHRARAQAVPVRRADRASRCQAARPHARRDQDHAAQARHDHDLCDP